MKKLKIGLLMDTVLDSDAGVQQVMKGLARFLLSKGHEIKFIVPDSPDEGEFKGKIISFGLKFNPFFNTTSVPLSLFVSQIAVRETLEREEFDIIHAAIPYNPYFGGRIISQAKCPVVATFMSYLKNDFHRVGIEFLEELSQSYKNIDYFIAPSLAAKEDAENVLPVKFEVIPHAVDFRNKDIKNISKLKKFDDGKFNLLFLGRFEERKGVAYLLNAFKIVQENLSNGDNIRLILAGDGPELNNLKIIIKQNNIKNVVFEGYVDEDNKPYYYESADLCVFPAIYGECFGVVLIEAMLMGKVPIVFGNEGYAWVMQDIPELIVENMNTEKLAEKMEELIVDTEKREALEKKCGEKSKDYSWEVIGGQLLEIYDGLL